MNSKPTVEQLAMVAAMLGAKPSAGKAVKRALQLFDAASKLLRADEPAWKKQEAQMDATFEDIKKNVPDLHGISISEALEHFKKNPAGKPIKSEGGFLRALQRGNFAFKSNGHQRLVRHTRARDSLGWRNGSAK